jgi:hypothetical protein
VESTAPVPQVSRAPVSDSIAQYMRSVEDDADDLFAITDDGSDNA